jgi:hypothetical protein
VFLGQAQETIAEEFLAFPEHEHGLFVGPVLVWSLDVHWMNDEARCATMR